MAGQDAVLRRLAALEKSQSASQHTTNIKMPAINITIDLGTVSAAKRKLSRATKKNQPGRAPMPKVPPKNRQGDPVMLGAFE